MGWVNSVSEKTLTTRILVNLLCVTLAPIAIGVSAVNMLTLTLTINE